MQACVVENVAVFEEHAWFFGLVQPSSCDAFGRCSIAGAIPRGDGSALTAVTVTKHRRTLVSPGPCWGMCEAGRSCGWAEASRV